LPPPDLAGFDDGGGALSFFGACKEMNEEVSAGRRQEVASNGRWGSE